jgi:hypothetical protein
MYIKDYVVMNEWTYSKENEIVHESGFRLELLAGSWLAPTELNPIIVKTHSPVKTAGLIREGLKFSKRQNPPKFNQSNSKSSALLA